jgi:hypothetical protein
VQYDPSPPCSSRTAEDDQIADEHLHWLSILIEGRGPHFDQTLIGTRFRSAYLEDFRFSTCSSSPAAPVEASASRRSRRRYAAGGLQLAVDEKPHRHRRRSANRSPQGL